MHLFAQELSFEVNFSEELPTNIADWSAKKDNLFFTITNNTSTSFKAKAIVWIKIDGEVKFLSDLNKLPNIEVVNGTNVFLSDMIVPSQSLVIDEIIDKKATLYAELFIYDEESKLTNYQREYDLVPENDVLKTITKTKDGDAGKLNIDVAKLHNKINKGIVIDEARDDRKNVREDKIQIDVALLEEEFKKKNMVFLNVSEGTEEDNNKVGEEYAKISKRDIEGMYANNSSRLDSKESVVSYLTLQQAIQKVMSIKKSMTESESGIQSKDFVLTIN